MFGLKTLRHALAAMVVLGMAGVASAGTVFGFQDAKQPLYYPGVLQYLSLTVDSAGDGKVSFTFANSATGVFSDAFIDEIYFHDGIYIKPETVAYSYGGNVSLNTVALDQGNPHLPGYDIPAPLTIVFGADRDGNAHQGIQSGEWAKLTFDLKDGATVSSVIDGLLLSQPYGNPNQQFVIGIKVQGLPGQPGSESYINAIPLPASAWAGLALMGALGAWKWRSRHAQVA